jgi:hypothetical protein
LGVAVFQAAGDVGELAPELDVDAGQFRPAFPGAGGQPLLQGSRTPWLAEPLPGRPRCGS